MSDHFLAVSYDPKFSISKNCRSLLIITVEEAVFVSVKIVQCIANTKFSRSIFYEKNNFYPHHFHSGYAAVYILQKRKPMQGMHQWQSFAGG
jgi:hypothetical protein